MFTSADVMRWRTMKVLDVLAEVDASNSSATVMANGLRAIAQMNPANRDIVDAQVTARRTLRDAKIEMKKEST